MSGWVVCPKRGEKKVSLEVCLGICETQDECDKFREVPEGEIEAVLTKMGKMPVSTEGVEIEGVVIEPEIEPKKDPEEASKLIAKARFIKDDIEGSFGSLEKSFL